MIGAAGEEELKRTGADRLQLLKGRNGFRATHRKFHSSFRCGLDSFHEWIEQYRIERVILVPAGQHAELLRHQMG